MIENAHLGWGSFPNPMKQCVAIMFPRRNPWAIRPTRGNFTVFLFHKGFSSHLACRKRLFVNKYAKLRFVEFSLNVLQHKTSETYIQFLAWTCEVLKTHKRFLPPKSWYTRWQGLQSFKRKLTYPHGGQFFLVPPATSFPRQKFLTRQQDNREWESGLSGGECKHLCWVTIKHQRVLSGSTLLSARS